MENNRGPHHIVAKNVTNINAKSNSDTNGKNIKKETKEDIDPNLEYRKYLILIMVYYANKISRNENTIMDG